MANVPPFLGAKTATLPPLCHLARFQMCTVFSNGCGTRPLGMPRGLLQATTGLTMLHSVRPKRMAAPRDLRLKSELLYDCRITPKATKPTFCYTFFYTYALKWFKIPAEPNT
jgi:hypothetical protein